MQGHNLLLHQENKYSNDKKRMRKVHHMKYETLSVVYKFTEYYYFIFIVNIITYTINIMLLRLKQTNKQFS